MAKWTVSRGAASLAAEFGRDEACRLLASLVSGEVSSSELDHEPWTHVLAHIGQYRHPDQRVALGDGTPLDLRRPGNSYLARSWAARALAYIGDDDATVSLVAALQDHHWRVRMTAAQSLGRLRSYASERAITPLLDDDHPRVRAAAALAIERLGGDS